jgi:ubiquitin conjugation factor E4 B
MDQNEQPPPPPPPPASTPDAPDRETMEAIRQRRLAKLGGPSGSGTPRAGSPSTETPPALAPASSTAEAKTATKEADKPAPTETRPKINISPVPSATPQSAGSASNSKPGITTSSTDSRAKRRASDIDGPSATAPPPRKHTPAAPETIDDYADRMLSTIFRVSVDASRTTDSHGHRLTFLPNLSGDLAEGGAPLKLSVGHLEEAIMEAATAFPHDRPLFDYLLPCWKRVVRTLKLFRGPAPEKEALLREARRLCFSNCIFALTVPELFRLVWFGKGFTGC